MNGFITRRNINPKFQLVHPGKLAENQLARSQNLLVTDERTSVKIFNAVAFWWQQEEEEGVWDVFAVEKVAESENYVGTSIQSAEAPKK